MYKNKGKLILISGPMYAAKTRKLIEIYDELVKEKEKAIAVTSSLDNRTSTIESRTGSKIEAIKIENLQEIESKLKNYEFIFIDEFHFFNSKLIEIIKKLLNKKKTIILAGLDKDFKGVNFESYDKLKEFADHEYKMTAVCHVCGKIARYSRKDEKKGDVNSRIEIDNLSDTKYFSSCKDCHPYLNKDK